MKPKLLFYILLLFSAVATATGSYIEGDITDKKGNVLQHFVATSLDAVSKNKLLVRSTNYVVNDKTKLLDENEQKIEFSDFKVGNLVAILSKEGIAIKVQKLSAEDAFLLFSNQMPSDKFNKLTSE